MRDIAGPHRYGPDQLEPVVPIYRSCSGLAAQGYQHVDGAVRMGRRTAGAIVQSAATAVTVPTERP